MRVSAKTNNLTFCALNQKIVFGVISTETFDENQCFMFQLCDLCQLFCGLFFIVKAFTKANSDLSGILCKKSDGFVYLWEVQKHEEPIIVLKVKKK